MKETTYDLTPAQREAIVHAVQRHLEARPGILFAYVYGSLLGDLPVHDVDVAVYLEGPDEAADPLFALDLAAELERALPAELRLPVDVRVLNDAPPGFQFHVYRGRFLFSRDDERWGRLVEWAIWRTLDMKPLLLEWDQGGYGGRSLDADLVRDRSRDVLDSVERLEGFQGVPVDAFLADQDALDVASYRLLNAMEAALQLCYHVAIRRVRQAPGEYGECFTILGKAGLLDGKLALRLRPMTRFRNLLLNAYDEVDYREVHALLQDRLVDLRAFVKAIGELL